MCRCGTAATGSPSTPTRARPRHGCTSTIASTPDRRGRAIWSASSTARSTTGCRIAGSSSSVAGIRRSGRCPRTTPEPDAPQSLSELLADPGVLEEMHAAFPVRLHGDPRRWTGADDRRHRRARCRRGRRIGVPAAPSGELPASPAVGASTGPRSPSGSRSSSTTSTSRSRCTATAGWAAVPSCSQAAATARSPHTSPGTSRCPATTSSPTSMRSPASCGACIRTIPSTACATAAPSSSSRRGCGASAHAARLPTRTDCPRRHLP